jgi:hypothetical protein
MTESPTTKKNFRVQVSWGQGSKSWKYFETLKEADLFVQPPSYNMLGFARKPTRITVQELIDGKWRPPQNKDKELRMQIRGGRAVFSI